MSNESPAPGRRRLWRVGLLLGLLAVLATVVYAGVVWWQLLSAEQLAAQGRWRQAVETSSFVLNLAPGNRAASTISARGLIRLNRPLEAEQFRRASGSLSEEDLHLLANGLLQLGKVDDAARVYRDLIKVAPRDLIALKRLAALELANNRWDEAEVLAKRLIEIPEGEVAGRTLAGSLYYQMGRTGTVAMLGMSVAQFERVVALDPDLRSMPLPRMLFWNQYAYGLIREGRVADARKLIEQVLRDSETEDSGLLTQLGQTYLAAGESERAEAAWRRAVAADPNAGEAWLALGRQAMKRGEIENAETSLKRAWLLLPASSEAIYALIQLYRTQGRTQEAEAMQAKWDALKRGSGPRLPKTENRAEP